MLTSLLSRSLARTLATSSSRALTTTAVPGVVHVTIEEARDTTAQALRQIGWDEPDAALQAEIMTAAELCGNNQGLVKMYQPELMAPAPDTAKPVVERETATSAVINGNQSPGMLAAVMAADLAVAKLEESKDKGPISIVCTNNTSTSSGQLAFYVERIARKGYIGVALCNSPEFVAAANGAKPVFGTNPLAVGIPQKGLYPFTFDMATSAIALFGVLSAKAKGEPLPENVAYGKDGNFTTDAAEVMDGGAISTFGGHKGMGLSLCVEILAGALSGGAVLGKVESKKTAKSWGHTFVAIRPDDLVDNFDELSASIIATVKASGPTVRISGERSAITAQERKEAGIMPVPERIWESIVHTSKHGISK